MCKGDGGAGGTDAGATIDGGSSGPDGGATLDGGLTGTIGSQVTILGGLNPSGVAVTLKGAGISLQTTTDTDGGYSFSGVPAGTFTLAFQKNEALPTGAAASSLEFSAAVPDLLFMGGNGFIVQGSLYPLAPIELPAGTQVFSNSDVTELVASPDGSHVAWLATTTQAPKTLFVMSAPDGMPVPIEGNVTNFQLAGDVVAYTKSDGSLSVASLSGTGTPLPLAMGVGQFLLSPDGSHVSFVAGVDSSTGLGMLELAPVAGGVPAMVATGVHDPGQFSPDGTRLAFYIDGGGPLKLMFVSGNSPFTLTNSATSALPGELTFSPDGTSIAFLSGHELELMTLPNGMPQMLASEVSQGAYQFSPDGKYLAAVEGVTNGSTGTIELIPLAGGTPVQLASGVHDSGQFSPDSTELAFMKDWSGTTGTLETVSVSQVVRRRWWRRT